MKNINQINLGKYSHPNYELLENAIYKNIEEGIHIFAINYELEENDDSQYPLELILDEYYLHISDFIDEEAFENSEIVSLELGGDLEDIQNAINAIIGKRVYAQEYEEEGETFLRMVIE